jgi:Bacterial dnaA protein helix-turn-helix
MRRSDWTGTPLDNDFEFNAETATEDRTPRTQDVVVACACLFRLTAGELRGAGRTFRVSYPRMLAVSVARELVRDKARDRPASLLALGRDFKKHHTSILHSCRRMADITARDAVWANARKMLIAAVPAATAARLERWRNENTESARCPETRAVLAPTPPMTPLRGVGATIREWT